MVGFLLDANLSPNTAAFLRNDLQLNAVHVLEIGLAEASDKAIAAAAKMQRRAVITFDLDYGELFHGAEFGRFGVIVLRTNLQNWRAINDILRRFFSVAPLHETLLTSLVIVNDHRYRISSGPRTPASSFGEL
jgi:predicted nuclease of predicted toxin-antitoxin system